MRRHKQEEMQQQDSEEEEEQEEQEEDEEEEEQDQEEQQQDTKQQLLYQQKMNEKTENVQNQHYDEAIEMSEDGSEIESQESQIQQQQQQIQQNQPQPQQSQQVIQNEYNPQDFKNLNVSQDISELFKHIERFKPNFMELDANLKVFIPEFIPAVGEVDAYLKMSRPDKETEQLGLYLLDEPCLNQSKKAKLDLMMNEFMKKNKTGKTQTIHSIENAEKNPKEILSWINDVAEIQKNKQAPTVSYSKTMPDIDNLMQVWPQEIEELLYNTKFPSEDIDLSLQNYCELACNFLDIPVHNTQKNLIESLHVLFTLYSEFKQNQHFQKQDEDTNKMNAQ